MFLFLLTFSASKKNPGSTYNKPPPSAPFLPTIFRRFPFPFHKDTQLFPLLSLQLPQRDTAPWFALLLPLPQRDTEPKEHSKNPELRLSSSSFFLSLSSWPVIMIPHLAFYSLLTLYPPMCSQPIVFGLFLSQPKDGEFLKLTIAQTFPFFLSYVSY